MANRVYQGKIGIEGIITIFVFLLKLKLVVVSTLLFLSVVSPNPNLAIRIFVSELAKKGVDSTKNWLIC